MASLLPHSPRSCRSGQSFTISIHETPRSVEKTSNDFDGASVEALECMRFRVFELGLVNLPKTIFDPAPILFRSKHSVRCRKQSEKSGPHTYHLDRIELAMKLWQENAVVTTLGNQLLKQRHLVTKIWLIAQKTCHATSVVLDGTDRGALRAHATDIESALLKRLLKTFGLTVIERHLLHLAAMLGNGICVRDDGVMLVALLPAVRFVHVKGTEGVGTEGCVCGRLVKNKQCLAVRMQLLEDVDGITHLNEELFVIPPGITVGTRVNDFSSIANNFTV